MAASGVRALNIPVGEPTVLPTEPEAIKRTPTPPPPEEQLPGAPPRRPHPAAPAAVLLSAPPFTVQQFA